MRAGRLTRAGNERTAPGRTRTEMVRRVLVASDAAALTAGAAIALVVADHAQRAGGQLPWALLYIPAILFLFKLYGLYDRDDKRLGHATLDDVPAAFHAMILGTLGLWGFLKLVEAGQLVFLQALAFLFLGLGCVLAARTLARRALQHMAAPERVLLVGAGETAQLLLHKIHGHPWCRLEAVGYLADDPDPADAPAPGLPHLGPVADLTAACRAHRVERAVMASPSMDGELLSELVRDANQAEVKISLLPSVLDVLGPSTEVDDLQGLTVLGVNPVRFSRSSWLLKRALDVTLAVTALVLLLPLLPVLALAIRLDSPGPVFFAQDRLGRNGRRFRLYKLRTMVQDAEERVEELRAESAHTAWLMLAHDPRVTRLGRFLRMTSIDELPQLWNVLRGDMSLVGPRPMPPDTDREITGWGRRRLDLTPGITGLWQVLGRTSIPFEEMLKLDYLYVTNWSVWGDLRLLLRTVLVVLARRGAN